MPLGYSSPPPVALVREVAVGLLRHQATLSVVDVQLFLAGSLSRPVFPFRSRALPGWGKAASFRRRGQQPVSDPARPAVDAVFSGYSYRCGTPGCTHVHQVATRPVPGTDSRGCRHWPTPRCPLCRNHPSVASGVCIRCGHTVRDCSCTGNGSAVAAPAHVPSPASSPARRSSEGGHAHMPVVTGRIFGAPPPKPRQPPSRPVAPAPSQVQSTLHRFIRVPGVAELPRITLGTDFAGMDAPALSLRALGVPFRHVFAAEILPVCREFIWENHEVETLFYDVLARPADFFPTWISTWQGHRARIIPRQAFVGGRTRSEGGSWNRALNSSLPRRPRSSFLRTSRAWLRGGGVLSS